MNKRFIQRVWSIASAWSRVQSVSALAALETPSQSRRSYMEHTHTSRELDLEATSDYHDHSRKDLEDISSYSYDFSDAESYTINSWAGALEKETAEHASFTHNEGLLENDYSTDACREYAL